MTTVLVADRCDPSTIVSHRCSAFERLLARARKLQIDKILAGGVSPDSSAPLSLRANALISASARRRLAAELRHIARDAERSRHPFNPAVVPPRAQILLAREQLQDLAAALESQEAIDARGVAKVELRNGASPLYVMTGFVALARALQDAIGALAVSRDFNA